MKQFTLDGMPIDSDAPPDYPGPLIFFTAPLEQMPTLLVEATGLAPRKALQQASQNSTVIALSEDRHWIAMVNKGPQGQYWVEVVERRD